MFICDRVKDMIISGGENVYPAEVESGLMRHPAIAEVAVIGAPDEKWGEAIVAVVVLKAGQTLTLQELRSFAGEFLARYKLPSSLETVAALPRNATGKLLKYQLRQAFARPDGAAARSAAGWSVTIASQLTTPVLGKCKSDEGHKLSPIIVLGPLVEIKQNVTVKPSALPARC